MTKTKWIVNNGREKMMKRDFELVRKLLLFFEEKDNPDFIKVPPIAGYDELTIKYHLVLLYDAGLLRCEPVKSSTSDRVIYVIPFELTWDGHEFLEKIRNNSTWNKIKEVISSKGGAFAFGVINQLATNFALEIVKKT
jgi:hypothetical protein